MVGEGQDGHPMESFAVIPRPSLSIQNIQIIKNSPLTKISKNFLIPERYESKNTTIFDHKVNGSVLHGRDQKWTVFSQTGRYFILLDRNDRFWESMRTDLV